jgi:hypothetical protein
MRAPKRWRRLLGIMCAGNLGTGLQPERVSLSARQSRLVGPCSL